jgi:hypothetical protein
MVADGGVSATDFVVRLEADVFPDIGSRPLSELSTAAFRDVARKIERRGALDIGKRVLQNCGQIMRYAVANVLAKHNPVAEIKPADILKSHKRARFQRTLLDRIYWSRSPGHFFAFVATNPPPLSACRGVTSIPPFVARMRGYGERVGVAAACPTLHRSAGLRTPSAQSNFALSRPSTI